MLEWVNIWKAIFLGVIEGLTEFLPVSSTAHLVISSRLIDFQGFSNDLFEIVIQSGAILAICCLYWRKIFAVVIGIKDKSQQLFVLNLILSFLPAAILGLLFYSVIKAYLFSNLVIALALIIGGLLMILIDHKPNDDGEIAEIEQITPKKALAIGFFQCLAMIPGVSRSGSTIIGALLLGLKRKAAAEYSFFLAIPTIFAASIFDLLKNSDQLDQDGIIIIAIGFVASFISAILIIKWFISFVSKHSFAAFGIYRIVLGSIILLFL